VKNPARSNRTTLDLIGALAFLAVVAAGCGYQFAASGSGLPPKAETIYVQKFGNHTRFTGLNDEFMRYLKDEISDHKRLEIVDRPDAADLVLNGEVLFLQTLPTATNSVGEPITYAESLSANATLTDTHTHKVLWTSRGLSAAEQVPGVSSSVITTSPKFLQQNLRSQDIANLPDIQLAHTQNSFARGEMMAQLAQNLYASMSEGF
jgi:hypothetical protein